MNRPGVLQLFNGVLQLFNTNHNIFVVFINIFLLVNKKVFEILLCNFKYSFTVLIQEPN